MKGITKNIAIVLLAFSSQLSAYQYTEDASFFFADALLWKLKEGGADNWAQEISPAGSTRTAKLFEVPFKWSPGLRLGVGRNNFYDEWDAVFSYTWFRTKGADDASSNAGGIYSPFLGNFYINNITGAGLNGPFYHSANIQWKLLLNIFDLEFGRSFQIDQFLKLRPFIGIKGGFINQDINTNWMDPVVPTTFTVASENLKNDFKGIGPSIGLNTTWAVYQTPNSSFNIIGNCSGALLWGHWRFKDLYQNNTPRSVQVHLSPVNGAATMARGLLGIEWRGCIAGANMAVRLGYEAQIWFNQIQFYSLNMGRLNNLMSLQGGVFGFDIYF